MSPSETDHLRMRPIVHRSAPAHNGGVIVADSPSPGLFAMRRESPCVLVVQGELDVASAPKLRVALLDEAVTTLDLAGVTFLDSSATSVLVAAHQDRSDTGGLRLRDPSLTVRRLLQISSLDRYLAVDPA